MQHIRGAKWETKFNTSAKNKRFYAIQHIHIVNSKRSSTQAPNIGGVLQSSTPKMLNEKRSQHKRQI